MSREGVWGPGDHGDARGRSGGQELPTCGPGDVSVTVRWERDGGRLRGRVTVENTGSRACRLPGKPGVWPLGVDGTALPVKNAITAELKVPDHVVVEPGQRAAALVSWGGWDGARASAQAEVTWGGGTVMAAVEGPVQPASTGPPWNISSEWFRLL